MNLTDFFFIAKIVLSRLKTYLEEKILEINNFLENNTTLKSFIIRGLFGNKTVNISFDRKVKIFISENGKGKTTILNIIVNFFTKNFVKLTEYEFKEIEVTFRVENEKYKTLKFSKNEFFHIIPQKYLLNVIKRELKKLLKTQEEHGYFDKLIEDYSYSKELFLLFIEKEVSKDTFKEIKKLLDDYPLQNTSVIKRPNSVLMRYNKLLIFKNFEVEYFPTYRRIEINNIKAENNKFIKYGMEDIEEIIFNKLKFLKNQSIEILSQLNEEILKGLENKKELEIKEEEISKLMNNQKIFVLLGKIKEISLKEEKLIKEKLENYKENLALAHYILTVEKIYNKQVEEEIKINNFINVCNGYLIDKEIIYLEKTTEIYIKMKKEKKQISFQALSSGEKQIVALFANLYLNNKKNLMILMDEPELSLSIQWQKKLLPDIINTGNCNLLFCNTHSPFIFDNEFDLYAEDLENSLQSENVGDIE